MCNECGYESPKWMGQCVCGAWNSMVEEKVLDLDVATDSRSRRGGLSGSDRGALGEGGRTPKAVALSGVSGGAYDRLDTGINEMNRVLGGGLVTGSLVLISGEPGIGKSTLILQAASKLAAAYGKVLYVSGEESEEQIKLRADRVCDRGQDNLFLLSETNMESILSISDELKPIFIIIDSIQTMYTSELDSAPGSISQVRACGNELMRLGKVWNIPIFIVAHVTKTGDLAGPKIIEHLVDCVLSFTGERSQELRILRALKNRFGTTSEIGAFEMAEEGLLEIENLSKCLLEDMDEVGEGSVATAVYEGTRPLILEVQALTSPTNIGFARRTAVGIDNSRLNMILAVLEKKGGLSLINQDVYVNVVGGLKPEGTSFDLAVALAIYSSYRGIPCGGKLLALGEIGLTGDLRNVRNAEKILREAGRMGFNKVLLPEKNAARLAELDLPPGLKVIGVKNIKDAFGAIQK